MWHAAILKLRGVPLFPPKVYRLVGGNQKLPDAFAERLGDRVKLNSPVTKIEHGQTGVRVTCRGNGGSVTHEADYLVCAMSAVMLRQIPVAPAWPAGKQWAVQNVPYYFDSRPIFQSKSKFWTKDQISPNMEFGDRELNHVWPTCEEVNTTRGLMVGTSTGPQSPEGALAGFRRRYPGKSEDIEKTHRPRVGDKPVGVGVRDAQLPSRPACEVLARPRRACRAASTSSARTPTT